jgi:hypothetical protein
MRLGPKRMNELRFVLPVLTLLSFLSGCMSNGFDQATASKQEIASGYCHTKLEPVGPSDLARPTQSRAGDYIDYYGSCDGPSLAEQIKKQQRFERFRFGRDFMPG